jgi:hypothetical protein
MLELRPRCEHCNTPLPYDAINAMICTFECTYCETCALEVFENVCPNCTGGFSPRPIRPKKHLEKHPPSNKVIYKPKDLNLTAASITIYKNIPPHER